MVFPHLLTGLLLPASDSGGPSPSVFATARPPTFVSCFFSAISRAPAAHVRSSRAWLFVWCLLSGSQAHEQGNEQSLMMKTWRFSDHLHGGADDDGKWLGNSCETSTHEKTPQQSCVCLPA